MRTWKITYQQPGYINGVVDCSGDTLSGARQEFYRLFPDGVINTTTELDSGDIPAELCQHGIDVTRKCSICIARDLEANRVDDIMFAIDNPPTVAELINTHPDTKRVDDLGRLVQTTATGHLISLPAPAPAVEIHTAGELHPIPKMPTPDLVINLSRLLDDPAHKPDARLVELDGLDSRVQDFVFATEGALDLYEDTVNLIERLTATGKSVTVLILCRGGKHRSVAFGDNLGAHFSLEATHHHKHLPRVLKATT